MSNIIGRGFMYDVSDKLDSTVVKIPRAPENSTIKKESFSHELHHRYLGEDLLESDFFENKNGGFELHQQKITGKPVDLITTVNSKVLRILENGANMQDDNNVLFDVFGMQGMVNLFNYYFKNSPIKKINDFFLPINQKYLKAIHEFPEGLLQEMNNQNGNPFLAHNMIEDKEGVIHFIDTDHRPLDPMHPLNLVGNWITQKALKDINNQRKNNK